MSDPTNQIIWFFGQSAAGKETLIRKLVAGEPKKLIEELELDYYGIKPCEESLSRKDKARRGLVNLITQEAQGLSDKIALLMKGQTVDLYPDARRVHKVKDSLPSLRHRDVFVWCEVNEVHRRLKIRKWPWSINNCERELQIQLSLIKQLQPNLETICVDATSNDYGRMDLPD